MNAFLIFMVVLLLFFVINNQIDINIDYNILKNNGKFKLKLFKYLYILKGSFSVEENILRIRRKNNKLININLKLTKKQLLFFKELNKNVASKIFIKNVQFDSIICAEDPFLASMISGMYSIISNLFFIRLKQNNFDATIKNNINTGFRQNHLKIQLDLSIVASIFDLLWALMITIINERRRNEKTRRKTEC